MILVIYFYKFVIINIQIIIGLIFSFLKHPQIIYLQFYFLLFIYDEFKIIKNFHLHILLKY